MPTPNDTSRTPLGSAQPQRPPSSTATEDEPSPTITAAPDADACGRVGCTTTDNLARIANIKPHPRTLCPPCRETFLARHAD
jgi:hypothetical protein